MQQAEHMESSGEQLRSWGARERMTETRNGCTLVILSLLAPRATGPANGLLLSGERPPRADRLPVARCELRGGSAAGPSERPLGRSCKELCRPLRVPLGSQ